MLFSRTDLLSDRLLAAGSEGKTFVGCMQVERVVRVTLSSVADNLALFSSCNMVPAEGLYTEVTVL